MSAHPTPATAPSVTGLEEVLSLLPGGASRVGGGQVFDVGDVQFPKQRINELVLLDAGDDYLAEGSHAANGRDVAPAQVAVLVPAPAELNPLEPAVSEDSIGQVAALEAGL